MHAKKIVDELLGSCLSRLHAKLAIAVKAAVCGVLQGGVLSLSQLARELEWRYSRHLGNRKLWIQYQQPIS